MVAIVCSLVLAEMSFAESPVGHRRTSSHFEAFPRSRGYSDEYERSSKTFSNRRDRPRESNGYETSRYPRDNVGRDDRQYGSRSVHPGPQRYGAGDRGRGPNHTAPKPSRVLGVFGLSLRTEERHLYDVMSTYGAVEDIQIVYDSLTGRSRGFAFVYFQNMDDAREARSACARGLELHDRILRVDYSLTAAPHQPTPGVYMGKDKRRNFPDRGGRYGYSDRRAPRSMATYRRSRSRSRSPPRRRDQYSPYHRRSRVISSSRSRSPPAVYSPGDRGRDNQTSASHSVANRLDHDGGRFSGPPKDTREWSDRSGSSR